MREVCLRTDLVEDSEDNLNEERKVTVGSGTEGAELTVDYSYLPTEQLRKKGIFYFISCINIYSFIFKELLQDF